MDRREFLKVMSYIAGSCFIGCSTHLQYISLEFDNDEEGYVELEDGTQIHYNKISGNPELPTFVYTHSFFIGHLITKAMLDNFPENQKLIWDLPGYGKSDEYKDKKYSIERLALTLDAVIEAVGVEKPIVSGHSLGGMISFQYVADFKDKARKALIVNAYHKVPNLFEMTKFLKEINCDVPNFFSYAGAIANYDLTDRLGEIKTPIVLVNGTNDPFIPESEIDEIGNLINTAFSDYRLDGESHLFSINGFKRLKQIVEEEFE